MEQVGSSLCLLVMINLSRYGQPNLGAALVLCKLRVVLLGRIL